jgi:hypothetical protein
MSNAPMNIDRRALLALAGAGALTATAGAAPASMPRGPSDGAVRDEARPDRTQLLRLVAQAHARLDGRPAFWVARGREYGFLGGRCEQIYERHVVTATRVIEGPAGGLKAAYCEAAYATAPGETEFRAELPSPFTNRPYPNPEIRPLRMTWNVAPDGAISARIETPTIHSRYDGRFDTQLGPEGTTLVDCLLQIVVHRGDEVLELSEVGPYSPEWRAERAGFVPAARTLTVCRPLPANIGGGGGGLMLGAHASRKHSTVDSVRQALTATERTAFRDWFESWEALLMAPEDFLLTPPRKAA